MVQHPPVDDRAPVVEVGAAVEEGEDQVVLGEDVEVLAAGGGQDVAALLALAVVHADLVEQGDPGGGEQRRVRPGGVLVVAGREDQLLLGDEAAAVGLVPDDLEQVEQVGAGGEVEDVRGGGAEDVRGGGAGDPAVGVGAGVVVDQDVRVAAGGEPLVDALEQAGGEGVVAVEEDHVVAGGDLKAGVAGPAEADVLRQVQHPDPRVGGGGRVQHRAAAVRGAVVHRDQFEVRTVLSEHRFEALGEVVLDLVHGDDDAEAGHGPSVVVPGEGPAPEVGSGGTYAPIKCGQAPPGCHAPSRERPA